jgi:hypothetical protein
VHLFDETSLAEEDQSFDLVSAIFVLHHVGPNYLTLVLQQYCSREEQVHTEKMQRII